MRKTAWVWGLLCLACTGVHGPSIRMDFSGLHFLDTPFPGENHRLGGLDGYPIGARRCQIKEVMEMASKAMPSGFPRSGAVYFSVDDFAVPMSLAKRIDDAQPADTLAPDWPVLLIDVDQCSAPVPTDSNYIGERRLFAVQPIQGFLLEPETVYVAAVRTDALEPKLLQSPETAQILADPMSVRGISDAHKEMFRRARDCLNKRGMHDVAALTVFKTDGGPVSQMKAGVARILEDAGKAPPVHFTRSPKEDPLYCTYVATMKVPVYQTGKQKDLPYNDYGGEWPFDESGRLKEKQWLADARVVLTVPKVRPNQPLPVVVFVRAGAGGPLDPMVDRAPNSICKGEALGTNGPAHVFAQAGFAGLSIEGPFTGEKNPQPIATNGRVVKRPPIFTGEDQDIFNVLNMYAIRDNLRQSAAEAVLAANLAPQLAVDVSDCGGGTVTLDPEKMAMFSHSMGSSIAPLALAVEPKLKAAVMSGAGGSYIEQIIYKQNPTRLEPVFAPFAAVPLQPLYPQDPVLNLFQWALEPADGALYADQVKNTHVLMIEGIVDHYILPPMARALALPLKMHLGGAPLDHDPRYEALGILPWSTYSSMAGLDDVALPTAYDPSKPTRVIVQVARNPGPKQCADAKDGHEVIFEEPTARFTYRCFLESFKDGTPRVPKVPDTADLENAPCFASEASR